MYPINSDLTTQEIEEEIAGLARELEKRRHHQQVDASLMLLRYSRGEITSVKSEYAEQKSSRRGQTITFELNGGA